MPLYVNKINHNFIHEQTFKFSYPNIPYVTLQFSLQLEKREDIKLLHK